MKNKKLIEKLTEQEIIELLHEWVDERFNRTRSEIHLVSETPGRMHYVIVPNPHGMERAAKKQITETI